MTPLDALALLADLGASPWLVRHHELVLEAATILSARVASDVGVAFDRDAVVVGAALHDAGKIVHPAEMSAPGHHHELAGRVLLSQHGVAERFARFCITHATWDRTDVTLEDLLVAAADKLWKGKREPLLERRLVDEISRAAGLEAWDVFDRVDSICEVVAADGDARLRRSSI